MDPAKITRRQLLTGAGGFTLALPLLPSLLEREAIAGLGTPEPRFIAMTTEHGGVWADNMYPDASSLTETMSYGGHTIRRGDLAPAAAGGGVQRLSEVLQGPDSALSDALVAKMNVVRGLDYPYYTGHQQGGMLGNGADKNGADPTEVTSSPRPTIDQVMAWSDSFYPDLSSVRERSIVLGKAELSWGWSSPQTQSGSIQFITPETHSLALFNRIFVPHEDPGTARPPVVDRVLERYQSLRQSDRRLSGADRIRLDEHLERLDELQRRLAVSVSCGDVPVPSAEAHDQRTGGYAHDPTAQAAYWQLFNDVVVAAMLCGTCRVATMRITDHFHTYDGDWHGDVAHAAAYGGFGQDTTVQSHRQTFIDVFLDLVGKLDVEQADGTTLLDKSLVAWTQESGNITHQGVSMPQVTAGSAGGMFRTGQYLDYRNVNSNRKSTGHEDEITGLLYNQWLGNVLSAMGVPSEQWAESDYGGYGKLHIDANRAPHYPSAIIDAAGDFLPWLFA